MDRRFVYLALCLTGCASDTYALVVDVSTDLRPGFEFASARVELRERDLFSTTPSTAAEDWIEGVRVAEFSALNADTYQLTVTLVDISGAAVLSRPLTVQLDGDLAVRGILTRDCRDVRCPEAEGSAESTACLGGRCVPPGCIDGLEGDCSSISPECEQDTDCPRPSGCGVGRCQDTVCLVGTGGECGADEVCIPEIGCLVGDCSEDGSCSEGDCFTSACEGSLCRYSGLTCGADTTAPEISADSFQLNLGATTTATPFVSVTFSARDEQTAITHYCLKVDDTSEPDEEDNCWRALGEPPVALSPSMNVAITPSDRLSLRLDFIPQEYMAYLWLRDGAGNTTTLREVEGLDRATIRYQEELPPEVSEILATNTDSPSDSPSIAERTVSAGDDIYIKWRAEAGETLATDPIRLWYTTDDREFQPVPGGTDLTNGANGACSVDNGGTVADDSATGCFLWSAGAPTDGYFSIVVGAEDENGRVTMEASLPLNPRQVDIIAGRTFPGTNASARQGMLLNAILPRDELQGDRNSFVVRSDGTVFFRDVARGILRIDPAEEVIRVLIPTTGAQTGDGGPIDAATLESPQFIALDAQERLLVQDRNVIRRLDFESMTIDRFIGGGSNTDTDGVEPQDVRIEWYHSGYGNDETGSFFTLPNGDIYFESECASYCVGRHMRVYRAATGLVDSIQPAGIGNRFRDDFPNAECASTFFGAAFDPITSALTHAQVQVRVDPGCATEWNNAYASLDVTSFLAAGPHPPYFLDMDPLVPHDSDQVNNFAPAHVGRDGNLYRFSRYHGAISRFDPEANAWARVAGTGLPGRCEDGTPASDCRIEPYDVYVSRSSEVYFMDAGLLRTIDRSGAVRTWMGQRRTDGDGARALNARIAAVGALDVTDDGRIVILDPVSSSFREFTRGGAVSTIAGLGFSGWPHDGDVAVSTPVLGRHWFPSDQFVLDPSNGDIFYPMDYSTTLGRLNRATGRWEAIVGGGEVPYHGAVDGLSGDMIWLNGYGPVPLGFDGTDVLVAMAQNDVPVNSHLLRFAASDGTATRLLGSGETLVDGEAEYCADAVELSMCHGPGTFGADPHARAQYDPEATPPRWLLMTRGTTEIRSASTVVTDRMGTLTELMHPPVNFAYRRVDLSEFVYYCDESGRLHEVEIGVSETELPMSIPSIHCGGRSLIFNEGGPSLIFSFERNGMAGVAEYFL